MTSVSIVDYDIEAFGCKPKVDKLESRNPGAGKKETKKGGATVDEESYV